MDDTMTVEILDGRAYLSEIALYLDLVQTLAASKQFVQGLVLAKFEENVNVLSIFKEVFKADDVIVMQATVDLDLTHELLLCSGLGQ
jgi:hypothetical protein